MEYVPLDGAVNVVLIHSSWLGDRADVAISSSVSVDGKSICNVLATAGSEPVFLTNVDNCTVSPELIPLEGETSDCIILRFGKPATSKSMKNDCSLPPYSNTTQTRLSVSCKLSQVTETVSVSWA